ncbi:chromosome partitioning protein [Rhodoblastus acidophilus]|uniref:ParA family protein n=1 Tax=Rhodoblastus acidophilus TaxID=1074 RepID=UPI0022248642|nr:ParA family protein [Rhodoblastus acidophilus]MCW2284101.1 chromosome partitioning protein [Rhodoblastus acidophilus]MCW2332797.1 chromosome partitioning protein [Rhodoblastus acidophilus]
MTWVLAICNRKGGCGKTTTAVNLAAELGRRKIPTLLIDLDSQGHAGLGLGVVAHDRAKTVHALFSGETLDLDAALIASVAEHVHVLPADRAFEGANPHCDVRALDRLIRAPAIADRFRAVVLDTPPAYDPLLVNALAAADAALAPIVPHALSAEGVRQLLRIFYRIATTVKPDLDMIGVLPVMINERIRHHRAVIEEIARELGPEKLLPAIRMDIQLAESFSARVPACYYAPSSRGVQDYKVLMDHLIENLALRGDV